MYIFYLSRGTESTWFLHHDNTPSHTAKIIRQFLSRLKMPLYGHRFELFESSTKFFSKIGNNVGRWRKYQYITAGGDYFEGDAMDLEE